MAGLQNYPKIAFFTHGSISWSSFGGVRKCLKGPTDLLTKGRYRADRAAKNPKLLCSIKKSCFVSDAGFNFGEPQKNKKPSRSVISTPTAHLNLFFLGFPSVSSYNFQRTNLCV